MKAIETVSLQMEMSTIKAITEFLGTPAATTPANPPQVIVSTRDSRRPSLLHIDVVIKYPAIRRKHDWFQFSKAFRLTESLLRDPAVTHLVAQPAKRWWMWDVDLKCQRSDHTVPNSNGTQG